MKRIQFRFIWLISEKNVKRNGRTLVTGNYKEALRPSLTKRVLTGLVAGVFDPLGLATPITAGFKLDEARLGRQCTGRAVGQVGRKHGTDPGTQGCDLPADSDP